MILKERGWCGVNWVRVVHVELSAGSCENGTYPSGSIKTGNLVTS
jgi:hypothetical protein